ncbi:hypothetical protein MTP99_016936 [Tenebrio molitor]|nr:hypothetical protein MTP99_016936 [Tenebrio molitor]
MRVKLVAPEILHLASDLRSAVDGRLEAHVHMQSAAASDEDTRTIWRATDTADYSGEPALLRRLLVRTVTTAGFA